MITRELAEQIWMAYREIETSKKLLEELEKHKEEYANSLEARRNEPTLRDAFGTRRHFQLGIPSGSNSHRCFDVAPELAESVIRAHIAIQESKMVELQERAKMESKPTPLQKA